MPRSVELYSLAKILRQLTERSLRKSGNVFVLGPLILVILSEIVQVHVVETYPYLTFRMFGGVSKLSDYVPTPMVLPCLRSKCASPCQIQCHK